MNYEQKYHEALERAKTLFESQESSPGRKKWLSDVFPELRESEDEMTRKDILKFFQVCANERHIVIPARFFEYIEKQKEKVAFVENETPKSLADEFAEIESNNHKAEATQDYSGLTDLERAIHRGFLCAGVENVPVGIIKETAQECLAQMRPAEWSVEDEDKLEQCIRIVSGWERDYDIVKSPYSKFLKSLRPQWRPSEEQMIELRAAISGCSFDTKTLSSLEKDLKKLM